MDKCWLLRCLMLLLCCSVGLSVAEDFLPPEQAFRFSARLTDDAHAEVSYQVAEGYYLYRERFAFKAAGATLGAPIIPPGKVKFDETFNKEVETHRGVVTLRVPYQADGPFVLTVTSQGCSDKGLCYSPMESTARLVPTMSSEASAVGGADISMATSDSEMGRIEKSLASGRLILIVPLFVLLGLGLSFTPCVLPMVPILSFIIVGEGAHATRRRGFTLALAYTLGMAVVYTALGITAGLIGEGLSAALQKPAVLIGFALLIAVLALSMFDVFTLQVPGFLQTRLTQLSERQRAGKLIGVFAMGAISALIVGPCVAAPLAGALVYISQTRDILIGGSALFAMAIGMSVPLLLVGLSAGSLLPRAGQWMQAVKPFFGVLMLALALWMVASLLPSSMLMLGWGLLAAGYGVFLLFTRRLTLAARVLGVVFLLLGSVQLGGLATGGRDPWSPLAHLRGAPEAKPAFQRIHTVAELDQALAAANGRRVMLDFYADWCVSCIEMEKLTFTDPKVKAELDRLVLLQADVTANTADDKALLRRFGLFGPPGIIFFDAAGQEVRPARVVGFQEPDAFLQSVLRVKID